MLYQLEMSCRSQVDAMAARAELTMPGENVLAHAAHLYQPGTRRPYGVLDGRPCCVSSPRRRRLPAIRYIGSRTLPARPRGPATLTVRASAGWESAEARSAKAESGSQVASQNCWIPVYAGMSGK